MVIHVFKFTMIHNLLILIYSISNAKMLIALTLGSLCGHLIVIRLLFYAPGTDRRCAELFYPFPGTL